MLRPKGARMNTTRIYWQRQQRRQNLRKWLARASVVPTAMLAMMGGALGVLALQHTELGQWLATVPAPVTQAATPEIIARFAPCGSSRITCVVDGDTFWLDGVKYRIADINTPEVSSPQCAHEADLGRKASDRLAQLLGAGPFTLTPADRDEDQYGRKLRVVERDGRSIGAQLVAEGLAHEWQGRREGWC
jgi:micrococcal nuclease